MESGLGRGVGAREFAVNYVGSGVGLLNYNPQGFRVFVVLSSFFRLQDLQPKGFRV